MAFKRMDFIIVPREIFSADKFGRETYSKREAFLDLVQMAAYDDSETFINGYRYEMSRGDVIVSKSFLAKRWGWNVDKVRRYMSYLERNGWCKCRRDDQCNQPITLISINCYDTYQGGATTPTTTSTTTPTTTNGSTPTTQYKEKEITTTTKKNKSSSDEKPLVFPFSSQRFMDVWNELVKQPKWKGKTKYAFQLSLNKLAKYDEDFAIILMEEAIEHGWQGVVFPDTDRKYSEWKTTETKQETKPKDPRLAPGYGFTISSGGFDF